MISMSYGKLLLWVIEDVCYGLGLAYQYPIELPCKFEQGSHELLKLRITFGFFLPLPTFNITINMFRQCYTVLFSTCICALVMALCSYSKTEGLMPLKDPGNNTLSSELLEFNLLLVSAEDITLFQQTHRVVGKQTGFSRLALDLSGFPPIKLILRDAIFILIRNEDATLCGLT